jgi:hypothetical protein
MDELMVILDELDGSRERVLTAIEPLPDEALLKDGAVGSASVAALLALQTVWEAELVTGLMRLDQGKAPEKLLAALAESPAYEAQRLAEYVGRDLDQIFDDWQLVRAKLEGWLEVFSERDLTNRKRFKSLRGQSLKQLVLAASSEKERAYTPALEKFAREWLETESHVGVIPLTAVLPKDEQNGSNTN